jgi:hydrogenase-1 operon protein HyaF
MKPIAIPIRAVGPGSQPTSDHELALLEMPREMPAFEMPAVPHQADPRDRREAAALIDRVIEALERYRVGAPDYPSIDVAGLSPAALDALNQALGEGEVSAVIQRPEPMEIQETVFAGVWRARSLDAEGRVAVDRIEVCDIPAAVTRAAAAGWGPDLPERPWPAGVMNAPMLLKEIATHARDYRPGSAPHVVNLTLLPLSPVDQTLLAQTLADGGVALLSRGFGKCRITSTVLANTWWVRYFNSVETLILNTVEVGGVPEVAKAAQDDLDDSAARLRELAEWLREE